MHMPFGAVTEESRLVCGLAMWLCMSSFVGARYIAAHAWEGGGKFHSGIRVNAAEGLTHSSMMGMADKTTKSIIEMPLAEHARRGNLPCRGRGRLINLGRLSTGCEIMHISDRSARICSKARTH